MHGASNVSDRLDRIISGALAGAALIVAVSFAYRTFFAAAVLPAGASAALPRLSPAEWEDVLAASITLHGSADAPVTIVEFADLECPACAAYQPVIYEVAQRHGDAVRVVLSHFPLPRHRFALPAAGLHRNCGLTARPRYSSIDGSSGRQRQRRLTR